MGEWKDKNVGIDAKEFSKKLQKYAKVWKKQGPEFIKEQSALLAREGAMFTPPFAPDAYPSFSPKEGRISVGSKADIRAGKFAIFNEKQQPTGGDLFKIFQTRKKKPLINRWIKQGYESKPKYYGKEGVQFPFLINSEGKLKWWHKKHLMKDGRTKKLPQHEKPMVHHTLLKKYAKTQTDKVGIAKAAFAKVAADLGHSGPVLNDIKKHFGRVNGRHDIKKRAGSYVGIIAASADGLYHTKRVVPTLMKFRLGKALNRLKIIAREEAKKAKMQTS